jgi:hypothetical protein
MRAFARCKRLTIGPQWDVARQLFQHAALKIFEPPEKSGADQTSGDPYEDAVEQVSPNHTEFEAPSQCQHSASDRSLSKVRDSSERRNNAGNDGHAEEPGVSRPSFRPKQGSTEIRFSSNDFRAR